MRHGEREDRCQQKRTELAVALTRRCRGRSVHLVSLRRAVNLALGADSCAEREMLIKRTKYMKAMMPILISVFIVLVLPPMTQGKEWRGIVPLHSTRENVESLLGPPPPPPNDGTRIYTLSDARSIYFLDEGEVFIAYHRPELLERSECLDSIPIDTILFIQVTFKKKPELSEFQIDDRKFITFDPSKPPNIGFKAYVNDEEGIAICTQDGKVNEITYYIAAKDRRGCSAMQSDPRRFCSIHVDFITPGNR